MKKYLFGILAIAAIGLSAFTTKKPVSETFYFYSESSFQRVEKDITSGTNPQKSLNIDVNENTSSAVMRNQSLWSTDPADGGTANVYQDGTPDGSSFMWKFTIPSFDAGGSDNNSTDGISLEEALIAIQASYHSSLTSGGALPATLDVSLGGGPNVTLTIVQSDDKH